jgi:hypothetical protein
MEDQRFPKCRRKRSGCDCFAGIVSDQVLKQQWRALYGSEPPHRISRELLTRAVAYRIQEQVHGGLKPSSPR